MGNKHKGTPKPTARLVNPRSPRIEASGTLLETKAEQDGHTFWKRNGEQMKPSERHAY